MPLQVMARYLTYVELRPLRRGVWDYEEHRAVFEGEVDVIFRHPNPLARVRPRRLRIPMIYILHIPPAYTYRFGSPPPHHGRRFYNLHVRRPATRTRPSTSDEATATATPRPGPTTRVRFAPSSEPVRRTAIPVVSDEEEEEDPVEDGDGPAADSQ